jgi:outer membrane protein TolC
MATAQSSAPPSLSLAEAVRRGLGAAPGVVAARAEVHQAEARQRETRSALLPSLDAGASYVNRTYNIHTFGIEFPAAPGEPFPDLVVPSASRTPGPRCEQSLFDYAALARVRSKGGAIDVSRAEEAITREKSGRGSLPWPMCAR